MHFTYCKLDVLVTFQIANKSTDNSIHKASRGLPYRINFPMSGGTVTTTRTLGITNEAIGCMS